MDSANAQSVQALILSQLRGIADEVKRIPELQARLNALDESTRAVIGELRTRDQAQQQALEDLRTRVAEAMACIAGLSTTLQESKYSDLDLVKRLSGVEAQVKATFDGQMQVGRRLREIESRTSDLANPQLLRDLAAELENYRPWLRGTIAFLKVVAALLATAAASGLLWLLAQSILGGLGG